MTPWPVLNGPCKPTRATSNNQSFWRAQVRAGRPGDAESAINILHQTRERGFIPAELDHELGAAYLAAGRPADAVAAWQEALTKSPNDPSLLYHLALAFRGLANVKETRKYLIKALEIDPAMAQAWCALALLDLEAGKWAEAAGLFRRAIAGKRDYKVAYQGLARACIDSARQRRPLRPSCRPRGKQRMRPIPSRKRHRSRSWSGI